MKTIFAFLPAHKLLIILSCLCISVSIQAQNADERVSKMMNEARWFDLEQELNTAPVDSLTPFLRQMAASMTHHYFNRPDSACIELKNLLENHQQDLGGNTMNMVILLGMNMARTENYTEAAGLMKNLCDQLAVLGMDSTQIAPYREQAQQYRALAACGSLCQPLHKTGEYRFPMLIDNENDQHSIETEGSLNGKESRILFDTGAGVNIITPESAKKYGLRFLDKDIAVGGVGGTGQGRHAIADTLRIGEMSWTNVPFTVIDIQTGHTEADKAIKKLRLPPVIGLPIMLRMQEIQLDFAHREIIIPAMPTQNPLTESNLLRTDTEGLQLKATNETGCPLYFHFDTGSYFTYMQPAWYARHQKEVDATGIPDSLRIAGIGGVSITRTYLLPQLKFRIGNGDIVLDSLSVNTGIDLHTGQSKTPAFSNGKEDGVLGLNALEKFSKVVLNFKDMYMEAIPY